MYLPKPNDFYALIEAMPLCIILHDAHTKEILWANAAALAALGFTLEELTPLKAPDMTRDAPKYRRSVGLRWLEGAARTGQRAIEWCYRSKQGLEILSEAVATLVHLEGRDVLMVQFRDISREDKVKRDLKRYQEALAPQVGSNGVAKDIRTTKAFLAGYQQGLAGNALGAVRLGFQPFVHDALVRRVHIHQHQALQVFRQDVHALQLRQRPAQSRVLILVSKFDHCLSDLLYRQRIGQLSMDVVAVVSNHPDLEPLAQWHGIPYHHFALDPTDKPAQEARVWQVIEDTGAELVILARYMQVLSPELCRKLDGKAINIHHSLLPGFKGAKPYHQAYNKGVKLVGATAHYINNDLDEGPIIAQGVEVVDHSHYPEDLIAKGRDIEGLTLARAVGYHIERRVFLNANRTVVL